MKKKTFLMLLALVLVFGVAVGGTVAFLTAQSGTVTNTFTVGNISIELKEHSDGTSTGEVVDKRDNIKIVPGATVNKDPYVTVKSGSEKCYVYVLVENNLVIDGAVVGTLNIDTTNWISVKSEGNKTLYRYNTVVDASSADQTLPVFTTVTYADTITAANINDLSGKTIVLKAYAHQSENLGETAVTDIDAAAWTALNA